MISSAANFTEPKLLSKELKDFARRQLVNATLFKGDERRHDERHMMLVPVWGVAIDDQGEPIGKPFQMITRDISAHGVGLFLEEEIDHDRLAIHLQIAESDVSLIIDLTWVRPMGPFYGSAGTFVEMLEKFPCELPLPSDISA